MENAQKPKLKIGLALGGGGAKGMAHLGVLKVFEQYGIRINCVAGCSVGAVFGSAYAMGFKADEIIKKAEGFTRKFSTFGNFNFFNESLISDRRINQAIIGVLGENSTFEDLKIPMLITAVDLESGEELVLEKGKLWKAARASSAIPFMFSPVFFQERYLVDGGLLNNVPVDVLREKGDLDMIIGVSLGGMTSRQYISGMVWEKFYRRPKTFRIYPSFINKWKLNINLLSHIFLRSLDIMRAHTEKAKLEKAAPDIIIHPSIDSISLMEFHRYGEAIEMGMKAAEEAMPEILRIIETKKAQKAQLQAQNPVENTTGT